MRTRTRTATAMLLSAGALVLGTGAAPGSAQLVDDNAARLLGSVFRGLSG